MANLTFTLTFTDGTKSEVKTRLATEIAFERQFNVSYSEAFNMGRHEHFYFMAHHASKTAVDFDQWIETLDEIDLARNEQADPSQAAVSTT